MLKMQTISQIRSLIHPLGFVINKNLGFDWVYAPATLVTFT